MYFRLVKKAISVSILSVLLLFSCAKEKASPIPTDTGDCFPQSYTYNIRPIIETSCKTQLGPGTGCHDAWIDDYSKINKIINDGRWETEIFIDKTMPEIPNDFGIDSLTQAELEVIQCWMDQGFPEN